MLIKTNEVKELYFNTPTGLNLERLFADFNGLDKLLPKIQFLLHQINKFTLSEGSYQLNKKNHSWFFGIKDGELSSIINRLVEASIIELSSQYSGGSKSKSYKLVNPYSQDNSILYKYNSNEQVFMQKLVADGYIVKAKEFSSYKRVTKELIEVSDKDAIIQSQQEEIEALKQRIAALEAELSPVVKDIRPNPNNTSETTEVGVKPLKLVAGDDVQTVTICQGYLECEFVGYSSYSNIISGMTQAELIDLECELIQQYHQSVVNHFSITINNGQLNFFTNSGITGKVFIQFKGCELMAA